MSDVIGMTDGIARMLTNMQVGAEGHALPSYFITGAKKEDFRDRDGNDVPVWESYLTAIKALSNEGAKVWQFQAGDLKNFTDAINHARVVCRLTRSADPVCRAAERQPCRRGCDPR